MLNDLHKTTIKGYDNAREKENMLLSRGYTTNLCPNKERGLWDLYYCHYKKSKNLKLVEDVKENGI
jgi:hypothetical protein